MIYLDISKSPGKGDQSEERYTSAKDYFTQWQEKEVLIRDDIPAIYLYYIDYILPSGIRLTRKGLVALVGLSEFSEGIVKPHEETFATVTADRLRLMETCQAQFSQIFSLYAEDGANIISTLERGLPEKPLYEVRDSDGGRHTIWPIVDEKILLILGSHMDHSSWFPSRKKPDTIYLSTLIGRRIDKILNISLEKAALDKPTHKFSKEAVSILLEKSHGSIEKIRAVCYEIFLMSPLPTIITGELVEKADLMDVQSML